MEATKVTESRIAAFDLKHAHSNLVKDREPSLLVVSDSVLKIVYLKRVRLSPEFHVLGKFLITPALIF